MNVFVTGATGFLGQHLCSELARTGSEVFMIVRAGHEQPVFMDHLFPSTKIYGDLTDRASMYYLEKRFRQFKIDAVVHLAAQTEVGRAKEDPVGTFRDNIEGTWNVLEAARMAGVRKVIVASSDKAYGPLSTVERKNGYLEVDPICGAYPYETSKACADLLAQTYARTYGMGVAITRCGNLYGPGHRNRTALIPYTFSTILSGEKPVLRSNGKGLRDYVFITDAVRAYIKLIRYPLGMGDGPLAVNVGTGKGRTPIEIIESISEVVGWGGGYEFAEGVRTLSGHNEIVYQVLDPSVARDRLGWEASTPLKEGLQRTFEWAKAVNL